MRRSRPVVRPSPSSPALPKFTTILLTCCSCETISLDVGMRRSRPVVRRSPSSPALPKLTTILLSCCSCEAISLEVGPNTNGGGGSRISLHRTPAIGNPNGTVPIWPGDDPPPLGAGLRGHHPVHPVCSVGGRAMWEGDREEPAATASGCFSPCRVWTNGFCRASRCRRSMRIAR